MTNKEYWNRRYLLDKAGSTNTGEDFLKEKITPLYQKALKEIDAEIEKMYQTFASQTDISLAEAKRSIKAADFKKVKFKELAEEQAARRKAFAKEKGTLPEDIVAEMEKQHLKYERTLASYTKKGQISRLELMYIEIEKVLLDMADQNQMNIYEFLADQYQNDYYRSVFKGQQEIGFGKDFAALNERAIEQAVMNSYQRKNFSDTLWSHRQQLGEDLRSNITMGLIHGESLEKMAGRVKKRMEVSRSSAYRLVRTETAYIYEQAARKAYEECGIEKYEYLATLDARTSKVCQSLDGKIFKLKDAVPGKNYPPMHPNCRSTTVAALDNDVVTKRIAKEVSGKYYEVPSDMSYKNWYKKHVLVAYKGKAGIIKLTDAQQYAVNDYMSFGAFIINEKLRTGQKLTASELKKIKALDEALEKCPRYKGTLSRSLIFYDDNSLQDFLKQHQKNDVVTYKAFTSMSKGREALYNPDGQVQLYVLDAEKGRDLTSFNNAEYEVLYQRGQQFEIKEIEEIAGVWHILFEEL